VGDVEGKRMGGAYGVELGVLRPDEGGDGGESRGGAWGGDIVEAEGGCWCPS